MSSAQYAMRRWWRRTGRYRPHTATGALVFITVAAYVVELLGRTAVENALIYAPVYGLPATGAPFEPWRMLTSLLLHLSIVTSGIVAITHIGFNMYALYLFGRPLEGLIGAGRLVVLYVLAGFGGSVAVLYSSLVGITSPQSGVLGASGAVFGVLAATTVVQRRLGIDVRYLYVLIAINFALGFIGAISWEAHVGGLVVGALVGWLFVRNRGPRRLGRAVVAAVSVGAGLVVLTAIPAVLGAT